MLIDRLAEKLLGGSEEIKKRKENGESESDRRALDAEHYDDQGNVQTITRGDVNVFRLERTRDNECWIACYRPDGTSLVMRIKSDSDLDILAEEESKKDK